MTAIGHLATGLLLKGRFKQAPLPLLLGAAAAPDVVWAALNLLPAAGTGAAEITRVARPFTYIGDQQHLLQPWSHSLAMLALLGIFLAGLGFVAYRRWSVAAALLLAVLGHFGLDYLVHDADLTLWPAAAATRIGPAFVLDAADPARGLAATAPLAAFALQALVVAISGAVFLRAFPVERPRGRLWFTVGLGTLTLMSLPLFLRGATTGRITTTQGLVLGALGEMLVVGVVLNALARRTSGRFLPRCALDGGGPQAVAFVRRLMATAGVLSFALGAGYLGQSMHDAQALPRVGATSTVLALIYILCGRRFVMGNPSALWVGVFLGLLVGPLGRVAAPGGGLALPLCALEVGLGGLSLWLVRALLRRDLLL